MLSAFDFNIHPILNEVDFVFPLAWVGKLSAGLPDWV